MLRTGSRECRRFGVRIARRLCDRARRRHIPVFGVGECVRRGILRES